MFFARVTRGHSGLDHSLKQQSRSVSPSQHTPSSQGMVGRHPAGLNELLAAAAAPTVGGGREMSWCVAARARCCSGALLLGRVLGSRRRPTISYSCALVQLLASVAA